MSGLPAVVSILQLGTGTLTSAAIVPASMTVAGVATTLGFPISAIMTTAFGGLPTGGGTGQVLDKSSGSDFAAQWVNIASLVTASTGLAESGSTTVALSLASTAGLSVLGVAAAASAVPAAIAGAAAQVLVVNDGGTGVGFGRVNLASSAAVTGVLPGGNLTAVNLAASGPGGVQGILPVPNGGTNTSSLTANGVLFGNGAAAVGITAQGATASVLQANNGAPTFTTTPTVLGITVTPTTLTVNPGFTVVQVGATSGSTGALTNFNSITISSDAVNQTAASILLGGAGLSISYAFGGPNMAGGRTAMLGVSLLTAASNTGGSNLSRDRVGVTGWSQANVNDGGTSTTALGSFFGMNAVALSQAAATSLVALVGIEADTICQTGSLSQYRWAFSAPSNGWVQGTTSDAAFAIYRSGAVSWKQGITFGQFASAQPIDSAGTLIGTDGSALTAAKGIDLSAYTFSGNFLTGPASSFTVNNAGDVSGRSANVATGTVNGYKVGGTAVVVMNGTTYTQFNDPAGIAKFFFGNTVDPTSYFRQPTSLFQNIAGTANFLQINSNGLAVLSTQAVPAGGSQALGITISSAANFGIFFGSGTPSLVAGTGSIYMRTDGTNATSRMYMNTNGSTTWTAFNTVA